MGASKLKSVNKEETVTFQASKLRNVKQNEAVAAILANRNMIAGSDSDDSDYDSEFTDDDYF